MSNSANIKYSPLTQFTPSDEEDEGFGDNVLYDSRLVKGPTMDRRNVFELERLGQPRISSPPIIQYMGKGRRTCVLVTVLVVILLGALAAVVFPIINHSYNHGIVTDIHSGKSSEDWTRVFNNTWSESSVTMMDVNGDGLDDIIVGLADQDKIEAALSHSGDMTMKEYCLSLSEKYPCGASVVAFRGYDGQEIWRSSTRSVPIYTNCVDVDINNDDWNDCIITGRHSTVQAVDLRSGKILWVIDPESKDWASHFVPHWNTYRVISLPDLDSDGVLDLLVTHGGDKDKEPWEHERKPGRLVLLSGKSGRPIGSKFLELPLNEETYMPPVKYVLSDNSVYVLFGSGGETVQGNLMAISLPDLYRSITGKVMPNSDKSLYTWLDGKLKDKNGVTALYSGKVKGVMVPPVLTDVDQDGSTDILISTFEGSIVLLDGKSLVSKWERVFPGMETYSSPAPGYFNSDQTLDFMVHLNKGAWDKYNSSMTLILNGADGSTIWSYEAGSYAYSSDLSLTTLTEITGDLSVFLMKLVGRNSTDRHLQSDMGVKITRRHLGLMEDDSKGNLSLITNPEDFQEICHQVEQMMRVDHVMCDHDLRSLKQEIFLLDRKSANWPLRILEENAVRYHYRLNHEPGKFHCHPVSGRHKDKIDLCTVLIPTSYTGAVGDVDADGSLDYIHITQMMGSNRSDTFDITGPISSVILSKHSVNTAVSKGNVRELDPGQLGFNILRTSAQDSIRHFNSLQFLSRTSQVWTQYLGSEGNSWYYVPP